MRRLSAKDLSLHLVLEEPSTRRLVHELRRAVFGAAPVATEAIRFHVLCYFHGDSYFKAIGGNICMIEVKGGNVLLSFIHGVHLPDPGRLLFGAGKSKRFVRVPDVETARSRAVAALVRAAAKLRPWD